MRLASLNEFRGMVYTPESAPSLRTLRARVRAGKIAGGRTEGARYYVDLDEYDRAHQLRAAVGARQSELRRDELLARLV